ncbi:MAG TPA: DNA-3-methyladenine glycosylase 2 family protein [Candidatus Aminicenantes bacterium]|nr:DNA-3-methyladenine glycosylase 2 family protein [Candidatus Aminicenantes bacterium]
MKRLSLDLEPVPPFRLDLTVWALRRRPDNIVDRWDGETYRRVLVAADGRTFEVAVTQTGPPDAPRLRVEVRSERASQGLARQAVQAVERSLGVRARLDDFYRLAERDAELGPVARRFRGFKPPRLHSPFEALANAIVCQQFTLTMGVRLLNGLAEAYGPAFEGADGVFHAFPRPRDLAGADVGDLRRMKLSAQKARSLAGLARSIVRGDFRPEEIERLDDRDAVERLRGLEGVGRWTAEYALLRGFGRTHVFPADDVGARNNLRRWLGLAGTLSYAAVHEALEPWRGHGGLVYFHLLLNSLAEKAVIAA